MPLSRLFGSGTLFPKLIAAFLLVIAPLYGLGLTANKLGESSVKEQLYKSLQSRVEYYLSSLEIEKNHIQKLEQDYVLDKDVLRLSLLSEAMPQYEWSDTVTRTHGKLQLVKSSSIYIRSVSVHILSLGRTLTDNEYISDRINADYEAVKPGSAGDKGLSYWNGRLFLAMPYPDTQLLSRIQPSYVVSIELDTDELRRALLRFTDDYEQSGAMLIDAEHGWSIVNDKDAGALAAMTPFLRDKQISGQMTGIEKLRIGGKIYMVAYRYSADFGAFLAAYVPQKQVVGQIGAYRGLYWMLSAVSAIIIIVYSYWIFRLIHRPLRTLVRSFRRVEEGQLETAALPRASDEFMYLFKRFNVMIERLRVLIQQVYEEKLRAQSAELKQLQSQINPHFLYNTYFILFRLAKLKDHNNVARFSQFLGEYFRYITRSAESAVPLEAEAKHCRTYMEIQNMRFHDRIQVEFGELPASCARAKIPKLTLQPIMENAYKHGLETRRRDGLIRVGFVRSGDYVLVSVEDNGETLTDERLKELTGELENDSIDQEFTGLLNVHRRLRIMYGPACGVAVSRGEWGGLRVVLKLAAEPEDRQAIEGAD
ncbi:MAG: histidine kinase [Paenibacillaceae bacterium]|nr:histidine kinase [Paenibacillaceae bacterium]